MPDDLGWVFSYCQNILWVYTDYHSDLQPFLAHTWSLAIEEQFYLIWPLLIFYVPNKYLVRINLCLIVFAVLFRTTSAYLSENTFLSTILLPSQLDLLVMGSLLACKENNLTNNVINFIVKNSLLIGIVALVVVILLIGYFNNNFMQCYSLLDSPIKYAKNPITVNIYLALGLISVGLLVVCINGVGKLASFLDRSYLKHLGSLSYGLYIYHWPIIIVLNKLFNNFIITSLLGLLLTYIVSFLSFNYLERYFINLKHKFNY